MRNPIYVLSKGVFYLLLLSTICFTSCDSVTTTTAPSEGEKVEEVAQMSPPPSDEAVRQFFHAWMADCANDHYKKSGSGGEAIAAFVNFAQLRIDSALMDSAISGPLGPYTRVWGPALSVTQELISFDEYYVVENLMYCTHKVVKGVNHYTIGIAGTNAISQYDWLHEDDYQATVYNPYTGGNIAKGSSIGLEKLIAFKDSSNTTLLSFLQGKIKDDPKAVISVAGHSLGGALTQVYSGYLKNKLPPSTKVEAWVYAGPTAGNDTFADSLIIDLGADNYYAYNNALDVVPHAWQIDSLSEICSIYEGQLYCKWGIEENSVLNLIVAYLKMQSQAGNFTVPAGQQNTFTASVEPLTFIECADFFSAGILSTSYFTYDGEKVPGPLNSKLTSLDTLCKVKKNEMEKTNLQLLMFLAKMGEEHTSAYTNYFFQAQDTTFITAVANYTAAAPTEEVGIAEEGIFILNTFLTDVYDAMYDQRPRPTCTCNQ